MLMLMFCFLYSIEQVSDSTTPMDRLLTHIEKKKMTLEDKALYNTK